jgi:hypothetical protein
VPQVLKEIVHWLTTAEVQVVTEANNGSKVLLIEGLHLEQGGVLHDDNGRQESSSTPHQQKGEQHQGIQLQEALVRLCSAVYNTWILITDQDLTRQFNEMAAKICSEQGMPEKTFRAIVVQAQEKLREEEKRAS